MLSLTKNDLVSVDGARGLKVWWLVPPEKQQKVLLIGWSDVVIVKPSMTWPEGLNPHLDPEWGKASFRVDYLKEMERVTLQRITKVPDMYLILGTKPKDTMPLVVGARKSNKGLKGVVFTTLLTEGEDPETFYVSHLSLGRVAAACEAKVKNLYLRLLEINGDRVVLAYNRGLRAVLAVRPPE